MFMVPLSTIVPFLPGASIMALAARHGAAVAVEDRDLRVVGAHMPNGMILVLGMWSMSFAAS
jgi:hypothetical protein